MVLAVNEKKNNYNYDIQKLFLSVMISSPTLYTRSQNILKPIYWSNDLKKTAEFIFDYVSKYNKMPTTEQISGYSEIELTILSAEDLNAMSDWYLETIESFCRHKAMEILIKDAFDSLLEKSMYGEIEKRCKDAMMITLQKDLGTEYFKDPLARLEKMKDKSDMTSTGWKTIDEKLYGGTNRGELTIWCAGSGVGKSLILQNQAINWINQGKNVLYVTLELSEELVGLRMDAMNTGESTKFIFGNMSEIATRLAMLRKTAPVTKGKLQIKKFPEAGTTVNDIRAYIKEYEIQTNDKFDAICIDYLDILYPTSNKVDINSLFLKDKMVSEEIRALAGDLGLFAATASQLVKGASKESDFDTTHIAGGTSKVNTADNVIAIFAPQEMKEDGKMQIQFIKARSSNAAGQRVTLGYDNSCMRISDLDSITQSSEDIKDYSKKNDSELSEYPAQTQGNGKALDRLKSIKRR